MFNDLLNTLFIDAFVYERIRVDSGLYLFKVHFPFFVSNVFIHNFWFLSEHVIERSKNDLVPGIGRG